ncbi:hypothetical protein AGDE_13258 [Angomonas deanei]|uniref:Uncharacterized protein n=1 Tax=Angomonas deanei TaxID=59799 RepID=A0A7G2CG94_9TRYP|nr:hypothetical protein AGDE_13258 [Angomonas deanei]CAD2217981.1 hypothetical protein, conserved [Angomonas deanei]|eukprot:EPY22531.1 hypothetical protein AGDE_13258 [Angomonas deanei]
MEGDDAMQETLFVPVDSLRQTFFSDLDASSKVNPNRRRTVEDSEMAQQAYILTRDAVVGTFNHTVENIMADAASPSRDASPQRPTDVVPRDATPRTKRTSRRRAVSAMATNVAAGCLAGAVIRRCTSGVLGYICCSVVFAQSLSFLGYANIRWKALVQDSVNLVVKGFNGTPDPQDGRLKYYSMMLVTTLSATIPRRLSFWAGATVGYILL